MSQETPFDYYRRREVQARALAEAAIDPSVRTAHLQMADRYATLNSEVGIPRSSSSS